ncbi:MAG: DUF86 domain-containing protein [Candidatus Magnetobacterium sp. LHC-1]|uniref:DUF86 domain-containing protein n=1 Tax=Candidatus Magnetobacterium casense TaxID=1455061 RepID=A0ABS6RY17_9BACT|nr:DUF86 domain-containing protein [Candidatus Magnetobacterium casensis]MBF0608966.1 DUF86 domain-containing protein [Nitrospirota bacterium]MBV6341518.1 DUF86 domain-containing protein [Candidatus Magnetobacterium casensis]
MKKDARIFIGHVLECIGLIEQYTEGKTIGDFLGSVQLQDSVIRRIEVMGEAVKNIPEDTRARQQEIPWKQISGMRDILIHEYFGVDLYLVWEVVTRDIPDIKAKILRIKEVI